MINFDPEKIIATRTLPVLNKKLGEGIEIEQPIQTLLKTEKRFRQLRLTEIKNSSIESSNEHLITRDGQPHLWLEIHLGDPEIDSLVRINQVKTKAIAHNAQYFALSNQIKTSLFKVDQGPLRELQYRLRQTQSSMQIDTILSEIIEVSLLKSPPRDRVAIFLEQYRRILNAIIPIFRSEISNMLESNHFSETQLEGLLSTLGLEFNISQNNQRISFCANLATQTTFIILNKIFCYQVLATQLYHQFKIKLPLIYNKNNPSILVEQLKCNFEYVSKTYDFAPIFRSDPLFDNIRITEPIATYIQEFIGELDEFNLRDLENDFIGQVYQALIPFDQKKELGQIYTPTDVAKIMVKLAITDPNAVVMDPSCGCGTFLREIYFHLRHLNKNALFQGQSTIDQQHSKILEQIWGVEINSFPAQLSMMTLSFMNLHRLTDSVGVLIEDFLEIGPLKKYMVHTKNLQTGDTISREMPGKFDVIIANPPYVKQERIPNKSNMLANLPIYASYRLTKDNSNKQPTKVTLPLTAKTDYYGFFLWYSTFFLKEGGTMCFIIPNKWMDVLYGQEIKQFLLDHFHIKAIIGFSKNVFPTAQVSTVILLLQKISKPDPTRITQFLNLLCEKSKDQLDFLIRDPLNQDLINQLDHEPYLFANIPSQVQRTIIRQKSLTAEEKWSFKYLLQSEMQRKLLHVSTITLHNTIISSVVGGIKTGANEFFYPTTKDISNFDIEKSYLKPGIKTGRSIPETTIITQTNELFLAIPPDVNKHVTPGIWKYIEHGEFVLRFPQRPSLNWKPWFTIPPSHQDCPDILFLRHIDSEFRARWNKLGCIVADGVRGIKLSDPSSILFYLGVLNSTFFYWQAHIRGRWEGQGDLQLLVYELKEFQIPNIHLVPLDKRRKVEHEMQHLLDRESQIIQQSGFQNASRKKRMELLRLSIEDRQNLDEAVLDTLGLSNCYKLLIEETTLLETHRLHKKI